MNKFIVVVFSDEEQAYQGVHALKELHAESSITLYSTAVLRRDAQGRVSVKDKQDPGPLGTGVGAFIGGLLGVLGGPAGAAIGLGGGAILGGLRDLFNLGVSDDFLDAVGRSLEPGKTAIVAEVSEEWVTPLDTRMGAIGGTVMREVRADFIDDQIDRQVSGLKAEVAQRRAERAGARAERMASKLEREVGRAEDKLRTVSDKARERMDSYKKEMDAKIGALQGQADKAPPATRARIEERISQLRTEEGQRLGKLEQAWKLTQQALNP